MKVLFYYADAGDKVANNDAYFHGNILLGDIVKIYYLNE